MTDKLLDKDGGASYIRPVPADGAREDPSDIPTLLRRARGGYGNTIAALLAEAGFDDLPRNGPFVLGGMANHEAPATRLVQSLGISRQATSQLIDTLVVRGYLTREINGRDRRRMDIELTERGRDAAAIVRKAVEQVDEQLTGMLTATEIAGLRTGLAALAMIKERTLGRPTI